MSFSSKNVLLLLIFTCWMGCADAQVSKVKELAKSVGSSDSDSDGGGPSLGLYFAAEFGEFFLQSLIYGHQEMMARRADEPWLLSLDIGLHGGYYGKESATVLSPSIRGNWGLFSSQIRYNKFQDFTGSFPTMDWQMLQFNVIAQPGVNFRIGSGFMHEIENNDSFYEQFVGLELHLLQRRINPIVELRWAEDFETGRTARFELNSRVDYFLARYGKVNVNLMAGFLYQRYYEQVNFYFFQTGLTFNIY